MTLTAGHPCEAAACEGLALYGMTVGGTTRWGCLAHRHLIGFIDQTAPSLAATADPGPQAVPRNAPPAASQGRLL